MEAFPLTDIPGEEFDTEPWLTGAFACDLLGLI
jgi:hypothetical protein